MLSEETRAEANPGSPAPGEVAVAARGSEPRGPRRRMAAVDPHRHRGQEAVPPATPAPTVDDPRARLRQRLATMKGSRTRSSRNASGKSTAGPTAGAEQVEQLLMGQGLKREQVNRLVRSGDAQVRQVLAKLQEALGSSDDLASIQTELANLRLSGTGNSGKA